MASMNPELNQILPVSSVENISPKQESTSENGGSDQMPSNGEHQSSQTTKPRAGAEIPKNEALSKVKIEMDAGKNEIISDQTQTQNLLMNDSPNGAVNGTVNGSHQSTAFVDMNNANYLGAIPLQLEMQQPQIQNSTSRVGELSKQINQKEEIIANAPESPRSRKRRLNTEKVRKYRQRKRAKMQAQLEAEGKPIPVKRPYKKRNPDTAIAIDKGKFPPESIIQANDQNLDVATNINEAKPSLLPAIQVHIGNQMSFSTSGKTNFATADLCDAHISSPERLQAAEAGTLFDFGGIKSFHGQIETVRCFESNPLVRKTLGEPGHNRVLVVDGGGSKRVAILGDQLAAMAKQNNWAGIIVNGCIRDSRIISTIPIGVKALGTHPLKSLKDHEGEKSGSVAFAGLEFRPGQWVYADEDGVIISENELTLRKL